MSKPKKLITKEESGFRVHPTDATLRFPSDDTLHEMISRFHAAASDHKMRPCEDQAPCPVCFYARAANESEVLHDLMDESLHHLAGPLAHVLDYKAFFAVTFMFFELAMRCERHGGPSKVEIEELNKLFLMPTPEEKKEEPPTPSTT